ncbi:MAG: helix-hairpin-helix domain-containing protein [Bacteroidia bacterium]|nr:helix-hairpin-helix domain-containing protein [Bacteroidia bacterium]
MKHSYLLIFFLVLTHIAFSQIDSTGKEIDDINTDIEDFIIGQEVDDQVDYTYLTDFLEEVAKKPLDLNTASKEDLLRLPGMNAILFNQLQSHIKKFGKLTSIYELQAVPGYSLARIRAIQNYVTVRSAGAKDISPNAKFTQGPPVKEVIEGLEMEFIQRFVWIAEEQRGYTPPDTTFKDITDDTGLVIGQDTSLSSRYAGSPFRSYTRLRARYGKNFSFAVTGEKDPGETFEWNPDNRYYGYDFLSGHVAIGGYGPIEQLVIGDYNLQLGQGMVLSRGLGFGKGSSVINSVKQPNRGLIPYSSVNENQLLRGAAVQLGYNDFHFTTFFSRIRLDAVLALDDALADSTIDLDIFDPVLSASNNLQTSGLHRTASELANRRSILETSYGGRLEYKTPTLTIGTTHYIQQFGSVLSQAVNEFNQFNFRGDQNYVNGLDFDWVYQNFNFFGEVARSKSGGLGLSGGFMASLSPTVDLSLLARHYEVDFHSLKGYVFAERPTALSNETGLYLGLRIAPNPKWTWNTYVDQFYYPWNSFRASFPARGWEFLTQLEYKPKRGSLVYVRLRSDNKQRNASVFPPGQKLDYLINTQRNTLRIHFQSNINRNINYKARIEGSLYTQGDEERHTGILVYQDLVWKIGYKLKLTGRYALFNAEDFDARIYAYENDVLGFFSIPAYSGQGSRYYGILNWKATRRLEFWFRVAQTRLRNVCTLARDPFTNEPSADGSQLCQIGTGLNQINSDRRTEFKFQLRYKF